MFVVTVIPLGNLLRLLPAVNVCCGSSALRNVTALLPAVNVCFDSNTPRNFIVFAACSKCVLWQ